MCRMTRLPTPSKVLGIRHGACGYIPMVGKEALLRHLHEEGARNENRVRDETCHLEAAPRLGRTRKRARWVKQQTDRNTKVPPLPRHRVWQRFGSKCEQRIRYTKKPPRYLGNVRMAATRTGQVRYLALMSVGAARSTRQISTLDTTQRRRLVL